jgi:hypothetical protein
MCDFWLLTASGTHYKPALTPYVKYWSERKEGLPNADTFPKNWKVAFWDELGFVFMLNWPNVWISAVCGSHRAVSLNSKKMTSDIKSPVAISDVPGDRVSHGQWHCPFPPTQPGWWLCSVNRILLECFQKLSSFFQAWWVSVSVLGRLFYNCRVNRTCQILAQFLGQL